jgi:3',5'-cyclic AMP phosphodiesterase CpdA
MRVVHFTDIHVEQPLTASELASKRALAAFNLHVLGRARKFRLDVVRALVEAVVAARPDLVVCTGDVTSTGTDREFSLARELLGPVLGAAPFLAIPGNHDVYTRDGVGGLERHFPEAVPGGRYPYRATHGGVEFVGLDVSRPWPTSQGKAPDAQLAALERLLADGSSPVVVLLHYPLRGRDGAPYRPFTRNLANARAVEEVLSRSARVKAVLHGHEHHGYRTVVQISGRELLSLNPGAGGYAHLPRQRRTSHFCVYDLDAAGRFAVERFAYDGRAFVPEAGGAFASGR